MNTRMLAVGTIARDCITLTAPSLFDPRQVVEHRVAHWHGDCYVAEARVDLVMTARTIVRGPGAAAEGLAWCQGVAPQAHYSRGYVAARRIAV